MELIIQALTGQRSFILLLPKDFATGLAVEKGDYMKCKIEGDKLIVEKADQQRR
jgi:antitoxin component of MazEF toxin-antitoxin module